MEKKRDEYAEFIKIESNVKSGKIEFKNENVQEQLGDLFSCPEEYSLAHCVAEDLSMGKGIAKAFKSKFKEVEQLKGQSEKAGGLAFIEVGDKKFVYYLVTKKNSPDKPTYPSICKSLIALREHALNNGVCNIAMPKIGCGLNMLEWKTISLMLQYIFKDNAIKIHVYVNHEFQNKKEPKNSPKNKPQKSNNNKSRKK